MSNQSNIFAYLLGVLIIGLFGLAFYASQMMRPEPEEGLTITSLNVVDLPGWSPESADLARESFKRSCEKLKFRDDTALFATSIRDEELKAFFGVNAPWKEACSKAEDQTLAASLFFEQSFSAYLLKEGEEGGLFTGYYEPELRGSKSKAPGFETPLLRQPSDLISVDLGAFREDLDGKRIAGRLKGSALVPYDDRAQIEAGALEGQDLPFVWIDDPVDAFFLHIQGSGRVNLKEGGSLRVGYAGQNGHPYTAIGRVLLDEGALTRENISMQSIREWLDENPSEAKRVMDTNKSYIFFRELEIEDPALGPLGSQGVSLTPEASLAIDRRYYPFGAPMWLSISEPGQVAEEKEVLEETFRRLVITQDTGGAIKGIQRGDFFWGFGDEAAEKAGAMKSSGLMYVLVPKGVGNGTVEK